MSDRTRVDAADLPCRDLLAPVGDVERPLWSVMIPTYNCAGYLAETLRSVLVQDPGPELMQIEVVDDASDKDDPEAVVTEIGKGRVQFYRRPLNGGHTANFRTCLERSRGRYVHLLHGDDAVCEGFYSRLQRGFEACSEAGAAFCRHIYINERGERIWLSALERAQSGVLEGWLERIAVRQLIQTPSIVVRRAVYERLGTFDRRLSWVEDWEMWCRIAAHYPVWYEPEPLALYRVHGNSSTGQKLRTGENLRDVRRAVDIIQAYLPPEVAPQIRRKTLEFWAEDALVNRIPPLMAAGDLKAAGCQLREALRCSRSWRTYARAARVPASAVRMAANQLAARIATPRAP
jgi:glycosyltransferase involved in cell wall biosynthesis